MVAKKVFQISFLVAVLMYAATIGIEFADICLASTAWWDDYMLLFFPLSTGALVSFSVYLLVVWYPERKKRRVVKDHFREFYRDVKKDLAVQVIFASQKGGRKDLHVDGHTEKKLLTVDGFKEVFDGGSEADEGFYAFCNGVTEDGQEFREITWVLKMLAKEIDYVFHNYTIADVKTHKFFRRLQVHLMRLSELRVENDLDNDALCGAILDVFKGFRNYKNRGERSIFIEEMIEKM